MENWQQPDIASSGRRFLALMIDWLACLAIANLARLEPIAISTLIIFYIEIALLTSFTQASAGQRILRLKVVDFTNGGYIGVKRTLIRTFLILLVLPAVFTREQRGLHDWATNAKVIRV